MIVPKLKRHKKGAAVNYLSCCMKIEKKSVWLSCSLAWLSLAGVGSLPVLYSFLALRIQSSFFFPHSQTPSCPVPTVPTCKLHPPAEWPCPASMPCKENCAEIPQLAETDRPSPHHGLAGVELSQVLSRHAVNLLRRQSLVAKNQVQMN